MSPTKTSLSALAITALLGIPSAGSTPYHLTICGGGSPAPSSPCYVQSVTIAPPPGSTDGLTDAALFDFLINGGVPASDLAELTHGITGANSAGYVWGGISGVLGGYSPMFVFHGAEFVCCVVDGPFGGISINDNGIVIGQGPSSFPFISPLSGISSTLPMFPELDAASMALLDSLVAYPETFWASSTFLAIDDVDRVFGFSRNFGAFLIELIDDSISTIPPQISGQFPALPEPASGALIVSALAMMGLVRRRR